MDGALFVRHRPLLLRLSAAAAGLATAIAMAEWTVAPARPDQLPGFMSAHDLDASGPMKTIVLAMLLPFLFAFAAEPLTRRLSSARAWASPALAAAWVVTLGLALAGGGFLTVTGFFVAATLLIRSFSNRDAAFERGDAILVPAFLSLFVALAIAAPLNFAAIGAIAMLIILLSRLATRGGAKAFALSPLGVAVVAIWPRSTAAAIVALVIAAGSPFALQFVVRDSRRLRLLVTFVVLPLFSYSYAWIQRPIWYEGMPRVDFFEDGHSLLPASEMLRGELPYRDIVPGHGLVSDGLFDYAVARVAGDDAGSILGARERADNLLAVAIYFVGFAATGSPLAGVGGFLLASAVRVFWTPLEAAPTALEWTQPLRSLPAIVALVFLIAAIRLRSPRLFAGAAACVAIAGIVSVDFSAYAGLVVLIGILLSLRSEQRGRIVRSALVGALVAAIPIFAALAAFGIFDDFFRVTFGEVLTLSSAYSIGFFQLHERFAGYRGVPDALALLAMPSARWFVVWVLIALCTAAGFASKWKFPLRRRDAFLFLGLFVVVEAVAYGERLNVHFMPLACVFTVVAIWKLARSRELLSRAAAFGLLAVALVVAAPTDHLATMHRQVSRGPDDRGEFTTIAGLRRADGALFRKEHAVAMQTLAVFSARHLPKEATFFDFASMPIVYYLLEKPCPIRQYEVPFFEPIGLQREVIDRISNDPTVVATLATFPDRNFPIDGVRSEVRAPVVAEYLRRSYRPAFAQSGVVIWRRVAK